MDEIREQVNTESVDEALASAGIDLPDSADALQGEASDATVISDIIASPATAEILGEQAEEQKPKSKKKGWIIAGSVFAALALAAGGFFRVGEKFHSARVEAGTEQISIDSFLNWSAYKSFSSIVSMDEKLDLNKVGDYKLVLSMAGKQEEVMLSVIDTTAPEVSFKDFVCKKGGEVKPEDFIESISDYSDTKVAFEGSAPSTGEYGKQKLKIVVTDASGNKVSEEKELLVTWLKPEVEIEIGSYNIAEQLVMDPETETEFVTDEMLANIDATRTGFYGVSAEQNGETLNCKVSVVDTTPPELVLRNITVYYDDTREFSKEDFIESVTDNSGQVETTMLTELVFEGKLVQTVTIKAEDPSGNVTEKSTKYVRGDDLDPPVIQGLTNMRVEKHSSPDYLEGVKGLDGKDGEVEVSVDASGVNLEKAGTYYITYTAEDKSGNIVKAKRMVVVNHDEEDTKALVAEMAAKCGNNLEAMRRLCNGISYSTPEYGGDDPVWVGFTTWRGNCYVHAVCYKALLDYYGYDNYIIHAMDLADGAYYSHYWNLVNTSNNGVTGWWHTDCTPWWFENTPTLQSDAERYKTLQNPMIYGTKDWDRSLWPASP